MGNNINSVFCEVVDLSQKGIQDAKETKKVKHLNLQKNSLSSLFILGMREAKWDSLTELRLGSNKIGNQGCKYLSRARIPQLIKIGLEQNRIFSFGMLHLAKAEWTNLQKISIGINQIGLDALKRLSSAKWNKKLNHIDMRSNVLFVSQFYRIILWEKKEEETLTFLDFGLNKVENCYLDKLFSILELKRISLQLQWWNQL